MKVFEITLSTILGATVGVALGYFVMDKRISSLEEQLALTTPIATVDFLSIAQNAPAGGYKDAELKEKLDGLKQRAEQLKDMGFVVLRHEQVYAAPDSLIIRDEVQ